MAHSVSTADSYYDVPEGIAKTSQAHDLTLDMFKEKMKLLQVQRLHNAM